MVESSSSLLGIAFIILGAFSALLAFALLRVFYQTQPLIQSAPPFTPEVQAENHSEAILIVLAGGRLVYINRNAREWFNAWEDAPSLERLSRRIRPVENFIGLCAAETRNTLYLDGREVEAKSFSISYAGHPATLVSMVLPKLAWTVNGQTSLAQETSQSAQSQSAQAQSAQAIQALVELNEAMAASLDLETTIQAILESIQRLIPSDYLEISIWSESEGEAMPYRLAGLRDAPSTLEKVGERYKPDQGYAGYLIQRREPLLIPDVETYQFVKPDAQTSELPINAYVGIPLTVANELVGTLGLASQSKGRFTENDLEILLILGGPAAIALHNAVLYREEQQRVREFTGLARLAQAVSSVGDSKNLFARLVESISPLLEVEFLGFLIYDENRRMLQGQLPFIGLHEHIIEWASSIILPASQAEQVWLSQEMICAANAQSDPRLQAFGLENLAVAAGIDQAVLAPLTTGGRGLGYLCVGDKLDGTAFGDDDLRLLSIIAGQASPIVENAALVKQSERRAQRAEALRRIASLAGSSATLDEVLKYSIQDLARLLKADKAALFLVDDGRNELRMHKGSLFNVSQDMAPRIGRISIDEAQFRGTATSSQRTIFTGGAQQDPGVAPVYKPIYNSLELNSFVAVPLIVRDRGIGELLIGSHEPNHFVRGDVQTIVTAGGLLANVVDRSMLYAQTDESLRRRVDQLTALTRVGRELNNSSDLQYLLQRVLDEAIQTTRADCGSITLYEINDGGQEQPLPIYHLGDSLPSNLQQVEIGVLGSGETANINYEADAGSEATSDEASFLEDAQPSHQGIRSELIVPIAHQDRAVGLFRLHASAPARFDQAAIDITEALAIQTSVALGSAYRYQEQVRRSEMLNRRVETLARLLETSQTLQSEQSLEQALENIALAIQASTQFETVLISVFDVESEELQRIASTGISDVLKAELKAHPQPWEKVKQILDPEFQIGRAFFIPYERMPVMPVDIHTVTILPLVQDSSGNPALRWHPEDMLILPLYSSKGQPLGLISVDSPRDGLRPDAASIETLEVFSGQAALMIENQKQIDGLKSRMDEIQSDLRRANEAAQTAQSHLPVLLHKDLEQTIAVQRLSEQTARIRAGMDIAEIVNRQGDRSNVLLAFGREVLTRMGMDLAILVEPGIHGPRLLHSLGRIPSGINIEALLGQRNPLHLCLQHGNDLLEARIETGSEWASSPLLQALEGRGFICLSIFTGARLDSALLAISRTPLTPFTPEDEQLFTLLTRQVAITLQNLNLLTEISQHLAEVNLLLDFNRQLSNLEPDLLLQILAESALHVLPMAQTSLVVLWDEKHNLLVPRAASGFNDDASIREISYLPEEGLPGKAFSQKQAIRLEEIDFPAIYNLGSESLLKYHNAAGGRIPISCLAVPIQRSPTSDTLGVLVLENFKTAAAFPFEAQVLVTSLTQQTALNLENSQLYRAAEQRANQLHALTGVAAIISSNLKPAELIESLLDQLQAILPYRTGTLWLRNGDAMVVRVARGFVDSDERQGLSVSFEDSALLKEMLATRSPIVVSDVNRDERFSTLVQNPNPSWLGIPLIASGEVTGVIALEMDEVNFYNAEHVQIATAFAGQAAVTLENASLYQQSIDRAADLDQRSSRLSMLNQFSKALSESLDPIELLRITATQVQQAIQCTRVSGLLVNPDRSVTLDVEVPDPSTSTPTPLPSTPLFDRLHQTLGVYNCEDIQAEPELLPLQAYFERQGSRSLLAVSLATGNELHAVLLVQKDTPYHFTADEIDLCRTLGNQAAIAIQNAKLYAETRSLTGELDQRVKERTEQLARAHQRTETLLRLITELSASLDLEQVLTRTLNVLNQIIDAEHITVLLARSGERKLHHLASVGYQSPIVTEEFYTTLDSNQGLAGWIIQEQQPALIPDLKQDKRWVELPNTTSQYRSAVGVPLLIGGEALGALLFFHRNSNHFSMDQLDLVQAAANQVAIAVNNAELYRLIRDQAEDLGNMVRSQQVETQRSKAILEDVADGVLVTDENMRITLFNDSAEKILGLNRKDVIGKTLEFFTGLFGGAASMWMDTIRRWSQEPEENQSRGLFSEQITLDDGRVVSVHLAPVSLRESFLGTVSIFRDITHQVEVDRLKSEFVATVSHELRTPMTSIRGYVDILLMGAAGSLSEQQNHFLQIVKDNTERLSALVNDLLDISRIETGKINLAIQPVDLAGVAERATKDLLQRCETDDKPMQIDLDLPRKLPRVLADPEQLRHILDNLLENAYFYTPERGHISVRARRKNGQVQVDVQDDGIGILPEQQSRVFERFYRGEHPFVLSTSGTGLGLSIVMNLVEMQKGHIWLESSGVPGEGSIFSFTLPVHDPDEKR